MKYPLYIRKGVVGMFVTWQDILQFCMLIVSLVSLFLQIENKKK